jgi:hypothetical protein
MNSDLTINTIVFAKSFDERTGSERRSTARGINTADILAIKRQDATDTKLKIATKRYTIRVDREDVDAVSGQKFITSAYVVVVVPALATTTQVDNVIATFRALVASTSPNYMAQVLNNES